MENAGLMAILLGIGLVGAFMIRKLEQGLQVLGKQEQAMLEERLDVENREERKA